tara:strand:+ start:1331 stop:1801 length:471 start_codon:yes stop_codon:yes gene_type:complete
MPAIQIVTKSEKALWNEMKTTLKKFNSYHFKKNYYPANISEWESICKSAENDYRERLNAMISEREDRERVEAEQRELEEAANILMDINKRGRGVRKLKESWDKEDGIAKRVHAKHASDMPSMNTSVATDVQRWNVDTCGMDCVRRSTRIAKRSATN